MKSEVKLAHVHLENAIIINEEFVQVLIIENPNEFYRMVSDLDGQFDGNDGTFVFSVADQIINPSKTGVMVSDVFHFDLNDKKVLNLLYKKMESVSFGDKVLQFNELTAKTISFLSEVADNLPFSLSYDEPQPSDYFKISSVKFEKNYDGLEEKIICFINALIELKCCEFFVFVNLKSVLSDEKLQQVYAHCRLEQVGLLLIENCKNRPLLNCEKAIIITEDLCEIVENFN